MELFDRAKAVRLRSHHDKYLLADDDDRHVTQDRSAAASRAARWTVEFVAGRNAIRLKSRHGNYLAASDDHFLLGMTGKKVVLSPSPSPNAEWEPIRDHYLVKLRAVGHATFLRANGGLPPWRNSVTHDVPHRTATQDWVLWHVDVVDVLAAPAAAPPSPKSVLASSPALPPKIAKLESLTSFAEPIPKLEGRNIYYTVANDNGIVDSSVSWPQLNFIGTSLPELVDKLKEETKLDDIIICTRNPVNQRLIPIQLGLPPSNTMMRIVVVDANSKLGRSLFNM